MLNDIIIGAAFGSFLCENCHILGSLLDSLTQACHYPLDLRMKLTLVPELSGGEHAASAPLAEQLASRIEAQHGTQSILLSFTLGCDYHLGAYVVTRIEDVDIVPDYHCLTGLLRNLGPYYPTLFWVVGAAGSCGMTMVVSLLSDIITLFTLHLRICYILSATAFRHELGLAGSLWNLFRGRFGETAQDSSTDSALRCVGKRFNVLRNRLDSWDYDIDQLLLGTILFTLVAFLYPTVLTYYALFASVRRMNLASAPGSPFSSRCTSPSLSCMACSTLSPPS